MNTIYNVVWNSTTGTWVVASEMAKGRKKKSKAASAATAAALVTVAGLGAAAAVMPSTAMAGTSGLCMTSIVQGGKAVRPFETYTAPSNPQGSCLDTYGWNSSSYQYNISGDPTTAPMQLSNSVFLRAATTDPNKVSAMWLNGDEGSINFDIGGVLGQVIKIKSNGQMSGLTDGLIAKGSTDAITGNQAFALQSKITEIENGTGKVKYFNVNSTAADSVASGPESIAIGPVAKAQSVAGVAIGINATTGANTNGNVAVGQNASAAGNTSTAIGNNSNASAISATALGNDAAATGDYATAVGMHNVASGVNSVAMGYGAKAKDTGDIALGSGASANGAGTNATALGNNAKATATQSTALGANATASHHFSAAIGDNSTTDRTNSVSVGNASWQRQVTFVAKGTQDTDAVNVAQLKGVTSALGGSATVDGNGNVTAPVYKVGNQDQVGVAAAIDALDKKAGTSKYFHTNTTLADSVNNGADSIAIGGNAVSDGLWSLAAGTNAKATGSNSVALGNSSIADRANSVSVGNTGTQRQITNMAKGTQGTDAVNLDQLKTVTAKIGGGIGIDGNGNASGQITVNGNSYNTVAEAIAAAGGGGGGKNAVSYDGDDHLQVTLNKGGNPTLVTNVANGKLEAGSKDAINGDQLYQATKEFEVIAPKLKYIKFGQTVADEAQATGSNSVAIGGDAFASGKNALALGMQASSSADDTLSAGVNSATTARGAVALGNSASAGGVDSVALGAGSSTSGGDYRVLSVGDASSGLKRRITNVADGIAKTDAATVGQVDTAISKAFEAKSGGATRSALLVTPYANPVSSTPPEQLLVAGPTVLAGQIEAKGQDALAIGLNTHAVADRTVAVGSNVTTTRADSVGVGSNVNMSGARAVAVGSTVIATGTDAIVLGNGGSIVQAANGVAIGTNAAVKMAATDSVVIGHEAKANAAGTVVLGLNSNDDLRANTVSVGSTVGADLKRQIINVAKGTELTDAVNVSQLKGVTDALGGTGTNGKAGINPDGTIKAPDYVVDSGKTTLHTVGDAITNIDGRITNVINGKAGLVQQSAAGADLTVGKDTDGKGVNFTGTAGARKLVGVADGVVASGSKEAVNGGQLFGTAKSVADALGGTASVNADGTVKAPSYTIQGQTGIADVGTALGKLDKATSDNITNITNVTNGKAGLVQQSAAGANLTVGKGTDGAAADFTGTAGARKLIGVADGSVASGSKEAVNGGQLFDVKATVTNITNGTAGLVQQSVAGANLTVGKDTDGAAVVFNAKNGTTRQIKGITAGVADTDGVNVKQLNDKLAALPSNPNAVSYDDSKHELLTLNKGGNPTKITNVAVGDVSKDSKDAVTGGQLYGAVNEITESVKEIAPKLKYIKFGQTDADEARASGKDSLAIGGDAFASGKGALALGMQASSSADNTLSAGVNSATTALNAVALGNSATAAGANSVALGYGSTTTGTDAYVVSVGDASARIKRRITNVADGIDKTDVATVGQVDTAISKAFEAKSGAASRSALLVTPYANPVSSTPPEQLLVAGPTTLAGQIEAKGEDALAIGLNTHAVADRAVAVGSNVTTTKPESVGVGSNINMSGVHAVAVGSTVIATGADAIVLGNGGSIVQAANGVAIGTNAAVKMAATDSVAIGHESKANAAGTVVLGLNSNDDLRANTVSVGSSVGADIKRQIINVAKGTQDTDVVNVSQLKDAFAKVIGGGTGAGIDKDGNVTQPTFTIGSKDTHTVGDALEAVEALAVTGSANGVKYDTDAHDKVTFDGKDGTTLTGLKDGALEKGSKDAVTGNQLNDTNVAISKIVQGTSGLVQQAKAGDDLTVGMATDGKGVNFTGTAGDRILHGVAGGKIDSDAVNISQLKDVASVISKDAAVDAATGKITLPAVDVNGTKYDDILAAINGVDGKASTGSALGVAYDDATKAKVTLNPGAGKGAVTIANVKAGVENGDAVNVKQLKDAGLIGSGGEALDAVVYDKGTEKAELTFGGDAGTKLKNVAAGLISATSQDGINGAQLFEAGQSVADAIGGGSKMVDGKVTKPKIELAGGAEFTNVTDAIKAIDAKAATGNPLGVAYDDETKASVTLNKGNAPVKLGNVKNGVDQNDAVNFSQLKPAVDALGGGAKVDPATGAVTGPTYNLTKVDGSGKDPVQTVGAAIDNLDGRTAQNTTNITNVLNGKAGLVQQAAPGQKLTVGKDTDGTEVNFANKTGADRKLSGVAKGTADNDAVNVKQLKDAGLVDGKGNIANAVTYDSDAKDSVTLGNTGKPVTLKNVAAGTKDDEAINFGQFKKSGLVDTDGNSLDAVVYDAGSSKGSVTFGGVNGTVLNNVADGRIETNSRQAINGGQLAAIKDVLEGKITNIDNRVTKIEVNGGGGGTPGYVSANGIGGSPKPADAGSTPGVALGFDSNAAGDGASVIGDHAHGAGKDSVAIGNNASTTEAGSNSVALGNGSVADRADTVSVGSAGHERTVSNVARGTADTDAVNVGLLNDRINAVGAASNEYTKNAINDVWTNLSEEIDHSNRQANRGIAAASALINVTPYVPGHVTVNAGVAGYRGESALGVGVSRWSDNGRVNLNAGVSAAQGDEPVYRVGIGYIF